MTGQHIITASRSHALRAAGFLSRLRRRREDPFTGPDADLQDGGEEMSLREALELLEPLPAAPWERSAQPAQPAEPGDGTWWGLTQLDNPPQMSRGYVPDPLGQFPLFSVPDPGPQADLGRCVIFRDAVRDHFVRQERVQGTVPDGPPWYVQYARVYRQRTGLIPVREPDFALHRWDSVVDEIVAQSAAAAEAAWAAEKAAAAAPAVCAEYTARHSAGREAA